ncbi:MAG: hypothetical protein QOK10_1293, partial [Pseudonocardiales bacterium]|nr:hypothetical protein [Pseudonocardiales bacterium]
MGSRKVGAPRRSVESTLGASRIGI